MPKAKYKKKSPEVKKCGDTLPVEKKKVYKNILSHNNMLQRLIKRRQYHCEINSLLAKTHIMTDIELVHEMNSHTFRRSSIKWADLDPVEHRYVLLGKNDSSICIYDMTRSTNSKKISEIGHISRENGQAHDLLVSCVQWYPIDAGLFTSSSVADKFVKIWDPNTLKLVDQFSLSSNVYQHHMSHVATKHTLIAAGLKNGEINLCDLRTGSYTHSLRGHVGPVSSLQWARHNQFALSSGGEESIRFWDVRSSKSCVKMISLHHTSTARKDSKKKHFVLRSSNISSLCYSYDGLWLISYGFDGQVCIWDAISGNLYKKMRLGFKKGMSFPLPVKLGITQNLYPDLIFVPAYFKVYVSEMITGKVVNILDPLFSGVIGAIYNNFTGDLYTYGVDMNFIVWTPDVLAPKLVDNDESTCNGKLISNNWSSDDDF